MPQLRPLAEFNDYPGLICALRDRARNLQVSGEVLDHVAGLPARYAGKLLSPTPLRQNARRVGMKTLGALLGALGVKLALFEDPEAVRKYGPRLTKRDERLVRHRQSKA